MGFLEFLLFMLAVVLIAGLMVWVFSLVSKWVAVPSWVPYLIWVLVAVIIVWKLLVVTGIWAWIVGHDPAMPHV